MMHSVNTNPETGIRYGVIALNNLDQDTVNWLWQDSTNLSELEAANDARTQFSREWENMSEDARVAADEVDAKMAEAEREAFIEKWFEQKGEPSDVESYVEKRMEDFNDGFQIEEPTLEGECEGVKYQITWLGGAPLLWVLEGPTGFAHELCSPCVPNAANLDGGFSETATDDNTYPCYIVPADWLPKE